MERAVTVRINAAIKKYLIWIAAAPFFFIYVVNQTNLVHLMSLL